MADVSAPPSEGFRLSQLIYDSRYRSITIQVVAMVLVTGQTAPLTHSELMFLPQAS